MLPPGDEHVAERELCASAGWLGTVPREPHPRGQGLFLAADDESSPLGTVLLLWEYHGPQAAVGRGFPSPSHPAGRSREARGK